MRRKLVLLTQIKELFYDLEITNLQDLHIKRNHY